MVGGLSAKVMAVLEKPCTKCGRALPLERFYRNKQGKYGRNSSCKDCCRKWRKGPGREAVARGHLAYRNSEKGREAKRRYNHGEAGRAAHKRYKTRNAEKVTAHTAVSNALAAGSLRRPAKCAACDTTGPVEGHHNDYTKPLAVEWLCRPCHVQHHREAER